MMYRMTKILLRLVGVILLSCLLAVLLWTGWMRLRSPMKFLQRDEAIVSTAADSEYTVNLELETRAFRDLKFRTGNGDSIRFTISLPQEIPDEGLPVLIILGGLEIGRESLKYIPYHGQNILIGYQYPYSPTYWYRNSPVSQIPVIQWAVLSVPAQVASLGRWIKQQPWAKSQPISLLGYSFGAMFIPAIYHLAEDENIFGPGILAYGGADLYRLFHQNLELAEPFRSLGAWLLDTAIYPLEPLHHLPHMQGEFLLINGRYDDQIPEASWRLLQEKTPEPKTVRILEESHMNPKNPELTLKVVSISAQWLIEHEAVNAIPGYGLD